MEPWMEVFKTGTHTDSKGNQKTWTESDLDNIVAKYNPAEHEAPVVIGHPKENHPAFGWIGGLKRSGQVLLAQAKNLVPEFVDMAKRGLFKKRSISLYPDGTLRHVGFLGAMPPAVKGLADVAFAEDESVVYEFEEFAGPASSGGPDARAAQKERSKKYNIGIQQTGNINKPAEWAGVPDDQFLDPVNYRYPCPDADHVRSAASYWGNPDNRKFYSAEEQRTIQARLDDMKKKFKIGMPGATSMSEGGDEMPELKELQEELKKHQAQLAEREAQVNQFSEKDKAREAENAAMAKQIADLQKALRKSEFESFCDALIGQGKMTPAMKSQVLDFMEILQCTGEYEFAEGGKKPALEQFKGFLSALPKAVEFSEVATKGKGIPGDTQKQRDKAISDYQEKHPKEDYKEVVLAVSKENPELFRDR